MGANALIRAILENEDNLISANAGRPLTPRAQCVTWTPAQLSVHPEHTHSRYNWEAGRRHRLACQTSHLLPVLRTPKCWFLWPSLRHIHPCTPGLLRQTAPAVPLDGLPEQRSTQSAAGPASLLSRPPQPSGLVPGAEHCARGQETGVPAPAAPFLSRTL